VPGGDRPLLALCLADLHSSLTALRRLDRFLAARAGDLALVLAAGDITIPGHEAYADAFIATVERHGLPLLLVHGNNDPAAAVEVFRRRGVTIHRRERELFGIRFVGFGGDGMAPHDLELADGEQAALDPSGAILLTHVPPPRLRYGADTAGAARQTSASQTEWGTQAGPGARRGTYALAPRAHICGHIHHQEGVGYLGATKVIKVGAAMLNRCATLDLRTLRAEFGSLDPAGVPHRT
jgi:Icc-related predicted phosphoesterase